MVSRTSGSFVLERAHEPVERHAERVAQDIMRNFPAEIASLRISSVVRPLQEETVEQSRPLLKTLFLAVRYAIGTARESSPTTIEEGGGPWQSRKNTRSFIPST